MEEGALDAAVGTAPPQWVQALPTLGLQFYP